MDLVVIGYIIWRDDINEQVGNTLFKHEGRARFEASKCSTYSVKEVLVELPFGV